MNFTRDPIIETIITPKDGFKLVIRNSKGGGHEEFYVDALQVILIGSNCFYRSLEKPKAFVVPASDYEVLEVRETRMVMKLPSAEKGGIKIGGGRESVTKEEVIEESRPEVSEEVAAPQNERRKEKKRFRRGRRGERIEKDEAVVEGISEVSDGVVKEETKPAFIIPPPSTLISETIARYKDIPGFASAFFEKGKESEGEVSEEAPVQEAVKEEEEGDHEEAPNFIFDDHA